MANHDHLDRLLQSSRARNGCQTWNQWRWEHLDEQIDLRGASLRRLSLSEVRLSRADLREVDLSESDLWRADLSGACLSGAHLKETGLTLANLFRAQLDSVDLHDADLTAANLAYADFRHADLSRAILFRASLQHTDLRECTLTETSFQEVKEEPVWPAVDEDVLAQAQREAQDPTTDPDRLTYLAWHWPGCLQQSLLATNPNMPTPMLVFLAIRYPAAFLTNPVLPLLFMESPHWLPPEEAQSILDAIARHPASAHLAQKHRELLSLIEQCAQEGM